MPRSFRAADVNWLLIVPIVGLIVLGYSLQQYFLRWPGPPRDHSAGASNAQYAPRNEPRDGSSGDCRSGYGGGFVQRNNPAAAKPDPRVRSRSSNSST
jgi:hypothetical protein